MCRKERRSGLENVDMLLAELPALALADASAGLDTSRNSRSFLVHVTSVSCAVSVCVATKDRDIARLLTDALPCDDGWPQRWQLGWSGVVVAVVATTIVAFT